MEKVPGGGIEKFLEVESHSFMLVN